MKYIFICVLPHQHVLTLLLEIRDSFNLSKLIINVVFNLKKCYKKIIGEKLNEAVLFLYFAKESIT